jgi:hypothetical protein
VSDDLKLSIILQAVDNTKAAVDAAVASIGRVEVEAKASTERAAMAMLGGYKNASEETFAQLKGAFWASKSAPKVEIVPPGAMAEINGFKSAVDALKRDFGDITKQAGGSIELDSGLAKRAAENYHAVGSAIKDAKDRAVELATAGKDAVKEAGELGSAALLDKIKMFGSALVAAGVGYKAFGWVKSAVDDAAKLGDELNKLKSRTGLAAEDLAGLKFAAEQTDTSLVAVANSVGKMEQALSGKKSGEAIRQIIGDTREPLEALLRVSEAIGQTADPIEQARIASVVFGKEWKELMPMLKEGPEALRGMIDAGKQYYANANEMAASADKYKDSLAELDTATKSLKIRFGAELLGPLSEVAGAMAGAARDAGLFKSVLVGIGGAFAEFPIVTSVAALAGGLAGSHLAIAAWAAAAPALTALFPAMAAALPVMSAAAPAVAAMVGAFAAWKVGDAVGTWLKGQIDEMVQAVTGDQAATLGTALYDLIEGPNGVLSWANKIAASGGIWAVAGKAMMSGLRDGIAAGLKGALGIGTKIEEAIAYTKATASQWVQVGRDIIQGLIDGVAAKAKEVVDKIRGLGSSVVREMKDLLGIKSPSRVFMAIGEQIGEGMVIGIASTEEAVRAAVEGLGETAIYAGDEATLKFIREQEQSIRELRGEMAALGSTAQATGTQARDWWGRFLPADAAAAMVATGERAADDIGRSLTDALLRGFEKGEGFADNLAETMRNLFGSLVLKPIIQPIVRSAAGLVTGALGSLLPGSAAASGGAAAGYESAFGGILSGAGSFVTGMLGDATAGIASMLGASTGVATGIGAFAASAVPVIGAIAALAGLFKKKPSGKYAWGSMDMASGDVFDVGSMTGAKYSQENNDAVAAMLQTAGGYRSLIESLGGAVAGSYRFSASDREGFGLALNGGAVEYTRDRDAFLDKVLGSMVGSASGLDEALRGLILTFDGSAEETAAYVSTLAGVRNSLVPALDAIGQSLGVWHTYTSGIDLAELSGGMDALMGRLTGYYQAFFSEDERAAQATKDMTSALAAVNLELPDSKAGFRALVEGLDLTSSAGREAFAVLMQLAPTFVQVADMQAQAAEQARAALLGEADVSGARSSIASALSSLSRSVDSVGGSMENVAASVSELASAGAGIRDWIRAARAGEVMALTGAQQYESTRRQYAADLALAQGGDVDASGRITQSADAYLGALRDKSASRDVYQTASARIINELAALPATQTWEQQVIQGLSNVTTSVESLKTGALKLEMAVTAQSEIEKVIKLIGDTTSLPRDVKELALATSGTIYRTIAAIVDSSWTDETYRLGFGATTDLTRTLAAIVGSSWNAQAQNLAFGTAHDLSRTLQAVVDSSWSEVTQRLAFGASTDISRTLNAIVGSSWDAQTTQMAFGLTSDLNRALDAVVGSGWTEESKMLAFGTIQDAVRQISLSLTTKSGADLNTTLAAMFAPSSTIQKIIQVVMSGDLSALQQITTGVSTPQQIADQAAQAAAAQAAAAAAIGQQTAAALAAQQAAAAAQQAAAQQAAQQAAALEAARNAWESTASASEAFMLYKRALRGHVVNTWEEIVQVGGPELARQYGIPGYASGGAYAGGLALVGEQGPELINFNQPGRVYTAEQTASMLNNDEMVAELRALRREVLDLRHEARATAGHTSKTARLLERAMPDGDALATRAAEAL